MKLLTPLLVTIAIFFISAIILSPLLLSMVGYSSAEGSYHALTHALILSLIFTVIVCTFVIVEAIKEQKRINDSE